jgi:hypothetical protein
MEGEPTTPNVARIYDYVIGGTHNFPVDRAVGNRVAEITQIGVQGAKLGRWFMEYAAKRLAEAHFDAYIDLATGLPTENYLHELVPNSTRILYNDHDPETISYAQQITGDRPNIRYVLSKIEDIDTIIAAADEFFGGERRVGIMMIGVSYFIESGPLAAALRRLHEWTAPGSLLAFTGFSYDPDDPEIVALNTLYKQMGTKFSPRPADEFLRLATPWQPYEGPRPVEEYAEQIEGGHLVLPTFRGRLGYAGLLMCT